MKTKQSEMLDKIRQSATRAFGEEQASTWLNSRWRIFDDRRPVDMASCEDDCERVLTFVHHLVAAEEELKTASLN